MQSKYKYLIKNTGILTISNFSSKLMAFFLLPLYTSVLSTGEYGAYDIVATSLSVVVPVLTMNIVTGVMRFCMDASYEKAEVFSIGLKYTCISIIIVGLGLCFIKVFSLIPLIVNFEILIFFLFVSTVLQQFATNFAKGLERITDLAVSGILGTAISLFFNIVFLLVFAWGIKGFYLANSISGAIVAAYLLLRVKFWKYIRIGVNKQNEKAIVSYAAPTVALQLGWWINGSFDKYMVAILLGSAENGLLSVAYKLPTVVHTVYNIFSPAWEISAIKEYDSGDSGKFYSTVFSYLNALLCIVCTFAIAFVRVISKILYAKDFFSAWRYVPFLLLSAVITSSAGFFGAILSAQKNTKSLALSTVIGAFVNIAMNFLLIHFLKTIGATLATVISSIAIFVIRLKFVKAMFFKKTLLIIFSAWLVLFLQSVLMVFSDLVYLQCIFCFAEFALFFDSLIYFAKKSMLLLVNTRRR